MFYLLEGPDGAGKSSLAKQFVGAGNVWHNKYEPGESGDDLYRKYAAEIMKAARMEWPVAIDRQAMSDYVYGTVVREGPRLSVFQINQLSHLVDDLGGLRVYVYADPRVIEKRLAGRGEDFVNERQRFRTRLLYQECCKNWPAKIDTTRMWN